MLLNFLNVGNHSEGYNTQKNVGKLNAIFLSFLTKMINAKDEKFLVVVCITQTQFCSFV